MASGIRSRNVGNIGIISNKLIYFKESDDVPDDETEGSDAPSHGNLALGGNREDGDIILFGNDGELGSLSVDQIATVTDEGTQLTVAVQVLMRIDSENGLQ